MQDWTIDNIVTITPNPAIDMMVSASNWQRNSVNNAEYGKTVIGGKGVNVSTMLSHIMTSDSLISHSAIGFLGRENDIRFVRHFHSHTIEDKFIRVDGETRTNIKITDSIDNDTTDINLPGLCINEESFVQFNKCISELTSDSTAVVLSGSLAQGIEHDFYVSCIENARQKSCLTILDTSGKPLEAVIKSNLLPHIMKPNLDELRAVTGKNLTSEREIITEVAPWFDRGLLLLVVSMGADGALFISSDLTIKTAPPMTSIVSTVGAGDSMVAGVVYGVIHKFTLDRIAQFATAVSVAKISAENQDMSITQRINAIEQNVTLKEILI